MKNIVAILVISLGSSVQAATNINSTNNSSWGTNVGFVNWRGDVTNGAVIGEYVLGGFIYGENVGWINLGSYNPANHNRTSPTAAATARNSLTPVKVDISLSSESPRAVAPNIVAIPLGVARKPLHLCRLRRAMTPPPNLI